MTWPGPHDFIDGPGNTASGEDVMDNFNYLLGILNASIPGGPGTSLPSVPSDGDEYIYVASVSDGVLWWLKYNAALGKWRVLGGDPLFAEVVASVSQSGATYAALTGSAGPVIAAPLAGVYDVAIGAVLSAGATTRLASMSYDIGATPAVDADAVVYGGADSASVQAQRRKTVGVVSLTSKYKNSVGSGVFSKRWMRIMPVTIG